MAKKEEQKAASPVSLKTVKLSAAETAYIQGLNAQKKDIDLQIMTAVQSVLETRDVNQTDIVGGLSFTEDLKAITFTVKTALSTNTNTNTETDTETF